MTKWDFYYIHRPALLTHNCTIITVITMNTIPQ